MRRQTEGVVRYARPRRIRWCDRKDAGRSVLTEEDRRRGCRHGGVRKFVVAEALGRPRSNGWYGEEGLGVGKLPGCSGGLGVVCAGRILARKVVGDREVSGKILRPGGALEGGVRGKQENRNRKRKGIRNRKK